MLLVSFLTDTTTVDCLQAPFYRVTNHRALSGEYEDSRLPRQGGEPGDHGRTRSDDDLYDKKGKCLMKESQWKSQRRGRGWVPEVETSGDERRETEQRSQGRRVGWTW